MADFGYENLNITDDNETWDFDLDPHFNTLIKLHEEYRKVELASGILLSLLSPITLMANILLLATVWKNSSNYFRSPTMYFIMGLSVTDLITGLVVEPVKAYCSIEFYLRYKRSADCSTLVERVADVLLPATANASFLIVLVLSLSQYIAVGCPSRFTSLVTTKTAKISVAITWAYSLLFSSVQLFWGAEGRAKKVLERVDLYWHSSGISIALVVTYFLMLRALHKHIRNRTSSLESRGMHRTSTQRNSDDSQPQEPKSKRTSKIQGARVMESQFIKVNFILIIVLLLCTLPTNIVKYILLNSQDYSDLESIRIQIAKKITDDILMLKFTLDAFVYVWRLARYRAALLQTLVSYCDC